MAASLRAGRSVPAPPKSGSCCARLRQNGGPVRGSCPTFEGSRRRNGRSNEPVPDAQTRRLRVGFGGGVKRSGRERMGCVLRVEYVGIKNKITSSREKMENVPRVANRRAPRVRPQRRSWQAPPAPPDHVPNKDKVFDAAVAVYKTQGDWSSDRAKLAADLFRKSLGTNVGISDAMLEDGCIRIRLVRKDGVCADSQWVSACQRGYAVTPPTHQVEDLIRTLDNMLRTMGTDDGSALAQALVLLRRVVSLTTWVPARELGATTPHPVLQVR